MSTLYQFSLVENSKRYSLDDLVEHIGESIVAEIISCNTLINAQDTSDKDRAEAHARLERIPEWMAMTDEDLVEAFGYKKVNGAA